MNSLRLQLVIIMILWVLAEGWFAYYWWPTKYFSKAFPSVGIPITAIALVMMAWAILRFFVMGFASQSIQGKVFGVALVLTASVLGGFAPYLMGQFLVEMDVLRSSFHGESGWPSAICSLSLWMLGAMFFLVCLVEILMKKDTKQLQAHE